MLAFDSAQDSILASESIICSWLIDITTQYDYEYNFSTKFITYNGVDYASKIISDNFNGGPEEELPHTELNSIPISKYNFSISNVDGDLIASDFEKAEVLLTLLVSDGESEDVFKQWKFYIPHNGAKGVLDRIDIECVSFIQKYLEGTYPPRPLVKDLYPSTDSAYVAINDNLCVPIPIGVSYIPVRSVFISADTARYYVLGLSGDTFDIEEVHAPIGKGNSTWRAEGESSGGSSAAGDHDFIQYTKGSYKVFQPIIADSDKDLIPDTIGVWEGNSNEILDIYCKYSADRTRYLGGEYTGTNECSSSGGSNTLEDSTASWPVDALIGIFVVNKTKGTYSLITNNDETTAVTDIEWDDGDEYVLGGPASVLKFVFSDATDGIGASTSEIDTTTFGECEVEFANRGLVWKHGFFYLEDREKVITDLCAMCHAYILATDKIYLKLFSKTIQDEIADCIDDSFQLSKLERKNTDSSYVTCSQPDEPVFKQVKKLVPAMSSTDYPSSDTFNCYLLENSIHAQNLAHFRNQRLYLKNSRQTFRQYYDKLALEPGDVIAINRDEFGGLYPVMIDKLHIGKELEIDFTTYFYSDPDPTNLVQNPGFEILGEESSAEDVFTKWSEHIDGTSTIEEEDVDVHDGIYSAKFTVDASASTAGLSSNAMSVDAGSIYRFSFYGKSSNAAKYYEFIIRESTGGTDYWDSTNKSWVTSNPINYDNQTEYYKTETSFEIQSGISAIYVALYRYPGHGSCTLLFDDVSLICLSILDDWDDLSYSAVTVSDASGDTTQKWTSFLTGPDGGSQNVVRGWFRLGDGSDSIIFDSDEPSITLEKDGTLRLKIDGSLPYASLGSTLPTAYSTGTGIWAGNDSGTYKARIGDPTDIWFAWDGSQLVFMKSDVLMGSLSGTTWKLGDSESNLYVQIGAAAVYIRDADNVYTAISDSSIQLGLSGSGNFISISTALGIKMYSDSGSGTVQRVYIGPDGSGWFVGSGKIYWDTDGNLNVAATITAGAGLIGGWTIDSTEGLYTGESSGHIQFKTTEGLWFGDETFADAPFRVNPEGDCYANNLFIDNSASGRLTFEGTATDAIFQGTSTGRGIDFAFLIGDNNATKYIAFTCYYNDSTPIQASIDVLGASTPSIDMGVVNASGSQDLIFQYGKFYKSVTAGTIDLGDSGTGRFGATYVASLNSSGAISGTSITGTSLDINSGNAAIFGTLTIEAGDLTLSSGTATLTNNGDYTSTNGDITLTNGQLSADYVYGANVDSYGDMGIAAGTLVAQYIYTYTGGSGKKALYINSSNELCVSSTPERLIWYFADAPTDMSWLYALRPREYELKKQLRGENGTTIWLEESDGEKRLGLIPEEVYPIKPEFVFLDKDNLPDYVAKEKLIMPLLIEIQNLNRRISNLEKGV